MRLCGPRYSREETSVTLRVADVGAVGEQRLRPEPTVAAGRRHAINERHQLGDLVTVGGSGLGKERWVVERTIAWLHTNLRLDRRYDRRDDIHEACRPIGWALICHQRPQNSFC